MSGFVRYGMELELLAYRSSAVELAACDPGRRCGVTRDRE